MYFWLRSLADFLMLDSFLGSVCLTLSGVLHVWADATDEVVTGAARQEIASFDIF